MQPIYKLSRVYRVTTHLNVSMLLCDCFGGLVIAMRLLDSRILTELHLQGNSGHYILFYFIQHNEAVNDEICFRFLILLVVSHARLNHEN